MWRKFTNVIKHFSFTTCIFMVFLLGITMNSCSNDDGANNVPSSINLVGTWENGETVITFNSNHTGSMTYYEETFQFKNWSVDENSYGYEVSAIFTTGVDKGKLIHLVTITNFTGNKFVDRSNGSTYRKK